MEYRYTITIAVEKKYKEDFKNYIMSLGFDDDSFSPLGNDTVFIVIDTEIPGKILSKIVSYLGELDENSYGYIGIGDNVGDITILGNPYKYGLVPVRDVVIMDRKTAEGVYMDTSITLKQLHML